MLALNFFFDENDYHWFVLPEKLLFKIGKFPMATPMIVLVVMMVISKWVSGQSYLVFSQELLEWCSIWLLKV